MITHRQSIPLLSLTTFQPFASMMRIETENQSTRCLLCPRFSAIRQYDEDWNKLGRRSNFPDLLFSAIRQYDEDWNGVTRRPTACFYPAFQPFASMMRIETAVSMPFFVWHVLLFSHSPVWWGLKLIARGLLILACSLFSHSPVWWGLKL